MDKLIGKAVDKVFGDDDDRSQGLQQGGGNLTHGGAYPAGGNYPQADDADLRGAASAAAKDAPEGQDFFADILGKLLQSKAPAQIAEEDLDEDDAVQSHRKFFPSTSTTATTTEPAFSSSLGSAAAIQALKLFTSSSTSSTTENSQSQSAFVGLAMAQAARLFDAQASQGNVAPGADKQSAVMKAGELALRMYLKSYGTQGQGSGGSGGGAGGGLGGLLSLAGRFMK